MLFFHRGKNEKQKCSPEYKKDVISTMKTKYNVNAIDEISIIERSVPTS